MVAGGDVGVFEHGDNVRELEMMVAYGMEPEQVLRTATSGNASIIHLGDKLGHIKSGYLADIVVVDGDPTQNISALRDVKLVMKDGKIFLDVQ